MKQKPDDGNLTEALDGTSRVTMRYILMYFDSVDRQSLERLKDRRNVEVYRLDGPDFEDQIELALLNDLILPLKLAYVGGETARQFDGQYGGVWVPDGPTVEEDLCRFWGLLPND